jgi:hypothetical protein
VLADILDGKISRKAAVEIYGLDPGDLANSE